MSGELRPYTVSALVLPDAISLSARLTQSAIALVYAHVLRCRPLRVSMLLMVTIVMPILPIVLNVRSSEHRRRPHYYRRRR